MTMEIKIGDTFEYEGKKLKVVEAERNTCFGCYFSDGACCNNTELGHCGGENTDYKPVIFVEVKDEQPQKLVPNKFDPKTLKPFDKVIARIDKQGIWCCELFSFIEEDTNLIKCCGAYYKYCIPYNDDTKHLIGTADEAPIFYRYWED